MPPLPTLRLLLWRSLLFYRRLHAGVILGVAITSMVIVGALTLGNSVETSLIHVAEQRLGKTLYALSDGQSLFHSSIAKEIGRQTGHDPTAILAVEGVLINAGSGEQLNQVNVVAVDSSFWGFAPQPHQFGLNNREIALSERIAELYDVSVADNLLLRIRQDLLLSSETPIAGTQENYLSIPVKVGKILTTAEGGDFSLVSSQLRPRNVFINRQFLVNQLDIENRSNVLLIKSGKSDLLDADRIQASFVDNLHLKDLGFRIRYLDSQSRIELISEKIFIPSALIPALTDTDFKAERVFSYFVNRIQLDGRSIPYSFAAGLETYLLNNPGSDEVIFNKWTAENLNAQVGQELSLVYWIENAAGEMIEQSFSFVLADIIKNENPLVDTNLMPEFPGFKELDNCRDWDPGIQIDLNQIRHIDEQYWDVYGGAPKVFLNYDTARQLWSNRFGSATAIRYSASESAMAVLEKQLISNLQHAGLLPEFIAVREQAILSSTDGVDFGELFLGLSFFILISALVLTCLLHIFSVNQRKWQIDLLTSLGFGKKQVRKLYILEGGILAILGSLAGLIPGILFSRYLIHALEQDWQEAVGAVKFSLFLDPLVLITGVAAACAVSILSIWITLRMHWGNQHRSQKISWQSRRETLWRQIFHSGLILVVFLSGFIVLATWKAIHQEWQSVPLFMSMGTIYLLLLILVFYASLIHSGRSFAQSSLSIVQLARHNVGSRSLSSLALVLIMAMGVFTVLVVGLNRHDPLVQKHAVLSGTGGFEWYLETTIPVTEDISAEGENLVSLRRKAGEDASCLNITRSQRPAILGLRVKDVDGRFSFRQWVEAVENNPGWAVLNHDAGDGYIPGIADQTVIQWGLGKSVGDTLFYKNDQGDDIGLILYGGLANSIFQGNLLISEVNFKKHFPGISGYNIWLTDSTLPSSDLEVIKQKLTGYGLDYISTEDRLKQFSAVENTYLFIFLNLGWLGLILATMGFGAAVLRNIFERSREIALMRVLGFSPGRIRTVFFGEHFSLILSGCIIGGLSAAVAVIPALAESGAAGSLKSILLLLSTILMSGSIWIWAAVHAGLNRDLLTSLRSE